MNKELDDLFDAHGNCPTLGDPYRDRTPTSDLLFDEDGYLKDREALCEIIHERARTGNPVSPFSNIVAMIHAETLARATKRSYPTIYLWR